MGYQVKYNSVQWASTYGFKLSKKGIVGRDTLSPPRDDGYDWPASSDVPVSIGASVGMKRIIVSGRIYQATHAALQTTLLTFVNALGVLRSADEFLDLEFEDNTTIYWNARVYDIKAEFIGSTLTSKYAQVRVVFDCHQDYQLHP